MWGLGMRDPRPLVLAKAEGRGRSPGFPLDHIPPLSERL